MSRIFRRPRAPLPPAREELPIPPRSSRLKPGDVCDRCRARAYVAAEIHGVDLMFCAHHFARWEPAIREAAAELLDERWQLYEAESKRKGLSA